MIDNFLREVEPVSVEGNIFALILPHAGYLYSGKTASFGYKLVKDKSYKTVIIMGPSHYYGFRGVSVYPEGRFQTPLGELEIDKEFTQRLLSKDQGVSFIPQAFEREHSIEVQLPFLQRVLSDFKIVPVLLGEMDFDSCHRFAQILKEAIGSRNDILVIASSDMYHGYDYEQAEIVDRLTLSYLKDMDPKALYEGLLEGKLQLCGGLPVVVTLILSKELGHHSINLLNYTNSAYVTGKKIKGLWTVGYASLAIDRKEEEMLNTNQRKRLLEIARKSIQTYLKTGKKLELSEDDPVLLKQMGAFVTLHKYGQLRGCIGNLIGDRPLYLMVRDMAVESAVGDPRFPPVEITELDDIEIEISVLSPLEKVDSADKIELGKHGVLVRRGFRSGVFLPQVAEETGWSKEEFLSYLCSHKAGLDPLAWKDKDTELYIFTAEVFSERDYR
ncbi:MAG: AmmeMemoRadiSam system protein B [Candidatus Omnitrophica bacterium]|nr:AmmeMemoRadiSam system protein B [Candidatus Omnitrophota bacterium]